MPIHFSTDPSPALDQLGGKGAALARLGALGFEVPPWFAVTGDDELDPLAIAEAVDTLGAERFAVRSSARSEDGAEHSFAGQFSTFLEVPAHEIRSRILDVRDSARHESVETYCRERGLPQPATPTVLVQRMIDPASAGVAFSADPVTGQRGIAVVSAVRGTGDQLVSGEVDGETWRVDRNNVATIPESAWWTSEEAVNVAQLARRCEDACGRPQDIEWAIDRDGRLWLLQSRPITTLSALPDQDDPLQLWDNSNIAESYGGVTTPLTFSFAKRIYDSVYREFCILMSVPAGRIKRADEVFPRMLGLIHGRVYYNLPSWYRVLALLPGFQLNRGFMEQMMGVREPLPDELVNRILKESRTHPLADSFALVRTGFGLIRRQLGLKRQIHAFQQRFDQALASPPLPLTRMSGQELVDHYRDLERQLLRKWDAPLVNDFFAMIHYGLLRSLTIKWAGDETGSLQNELLLDCGEIISAEPPKRILRMAELASRTEKLPNLLADPGGSIQDKLRSLDSSPELQAEFERYLTDFGDRCLEELKLESPTVRDDPASLLSSIGAMALRGIDPASPALPTPPAPTIKNPLKCWIFHRILHQARERIRCRENLRFERTRLFGRVRAILRQLGHRLHADGQLDAPEDVFYLELGEVLASWDATGSTRLLSALANQRRAEFQEYQLTEAPPDRFQTRGPIHRHSRFESTATEPCDMTSAIKGQGACPGRVKGRVRVVLDPRQAHLEPGEILVARQTDPGWVVLFPAASGLLVERGSLLSHSAIVSREMRLPCIVSLPGITQRLKTGDLVCMDGATGTVEILQS